MTRKLSASRATSFINSVSQIMIRGGSRWKLSTLTIMLCTRTIQFGQDFFHKFPTTVILEKPRSTWDGTNIGGLCPGIQRQNEFPHWQLWIGTKNAVKNWHLLQDCRIKTVLNTMDYEFSPKFHFEEHDHLTCDVNHLVNSIFEGSFTIVDFIAELRQIDCRLRRGNLMIHCKKCQNCGRQKKRENERFLAGMALTLLRGMTNIRDHA